MSSAANGDLIMEQMANAGQLMCVFAGCFPPSDEMAFRIPRGVGGPMALGETSAAWKAGASALQEIQTQLREQTEALGEQIWRGKDRDAFETQLDDLLAELGDSHNTAEAIGITLEVLCPVMALWPPVCLTAGMAVAAVAAAFYFAAASGIGDVVGASEAAYAAGLPVSEAMLTLLTVSEAVLIAALAVAQGLIAAAVSTDIEVQKSHGNTAIVADLGQAEVDGLGQVVVNAAQYGVSRVLNGKKPGGEGGEGGEAITPPETTPGPEDTTPPETTPGPEDSTPPETTPGPEDSTPPETTPGPEDTPPGGDGSTGDEPKTAAERGLERGRERQSEAPGEVVKIGVDTAAHQAADRTHAGSRLQELINDKSGWEGTE